MDGEGSDAHCLIHVLNKRAIAKYLDERFGCPPEPSPAPLCTIRSAALVGVQRARARVTSEDVRRKVQAGSAAARGVCSEPDPRARTNPV